MIELLDKTSSLKFVLLLMIVFSVFNLHVFPSYQDKINEIAGKEAKVLDTRIDYSLAEVDLVFADMGVIGRDFYKSTVIPVDMIYPIIYGSFFILLLTYLLKKITATDSKLMFLSFLPVFVVLFDYWENINILNLLDTYPNLNPQDVIQGELITKLKWLSAFISIFLVLTLSIIIISRRFREIVRPLN